MPQEDDSIGANLVRDLKQQIKDLMAAISKLDQRVFSGEKESLTMRQEFSERDIKALRNEIDQLKDDLKTQATQNKELRKDIIKYFLGIAATVAAVTLAWIIQNQLSPKPNPAPTPSPLPTPTPSTQPDPPYEQPLIPDSEEDQPQTEEAPGASAD